MPCSKHVQNEIICDLIAQIHGIFCVFSCILSILMKTTQILLVQTKKNFSSQTRLKNIDLGGKTHDWEPWALNR